MLLVITFRITIAISLLKKLAATSFQIIKLEDSLNIQMKMELVLIKLLRLITKDHHSAFSITNSCWTTAIWVVMKTSLIFRRSSCLTAVAVKMTTTVCWWEVMRKKAESFWVKRMLMQRQMLSWSLVQGLIKTQENRDRRVDLTLSNTCRILLIDWSEDRLRELMSSSQTKKDWMWARSLSQRLLRRDMTRSLLRVSVLRELAQLISNMIALQ